MHYDQIDLIYFKNSITIVYMWQLIS